MFYVGLNRLDTVFQTFRYFRISGTVHDPREHVSPGGLIFSKTSVLSYHITSSFSGHFHACGPLITIVLTSDVSLSGLMSLMIPGKYSPSKLTITKSLIWKVELAHIAVSLNISDTAGTSNVDSSSGVTSFPDFFLAVRLPVFFDFCFL